nr:hypothetical protein Iba_chr10bCG10970 [Ipomoea batatas]
MLCNSSSRSHHLQGTTTNHCRPATKQPQVKPVVVGHSFLAVETTNLSSRGDPWLVCRWKRNNSGALATVYYRLSCAVEVVY